MAIYKQGDRPLIITTPLGPDALLATGLHGHEAISELFHFEVDLLAEAETQIRFDGILGQTVTVEMRLSNGEKRYFNGLVRAFTEGDRDDDSLVHFRAELAPKLWLLTKKVSCRIFQHLSTPDILRKVFDGLDVTYELFGA